MNRIVPVNTPKIGEREAEYVNECLTSGWISSEGPYVSRFEAAMASACDRQYGIAVSNGSVALDLALASLDLAPGDEVIMPTFTIISCAAAIIRAGATPVLVDCDPDTWNMDVSKIEGRIGARTKAIMVVHIYGLPVDMRPVVEIASLHNLFLIEDAAEMHGQTYQGRPCGSFGEISTFSFYPNKHVTTGEGGMLLTDSAQIAEKLRGLRNLCFQGERRFVHAELGWNARMSNIQAALGLAQLERLTQTVERKRAIGNRYQSQLLGEQGIKLPIVSTDFAQNIYWVYPIILADKLKASPQDIMEKLAKMGIGTRPFFWCMHEQPVFQKMGLFSGERYPHAEFAARRGFYLPSGAALKDDDIDYVVKSLKDLIGQLNNG